ncbi:MAG: bifunctional metallophosphatase/5'-nucleotidase [Saprospirales bacterium]|nr:bifunctional metallophosphatase/5'-nucleotidase [Saprospirales bacterium]
MLRITCISLVLLFTLFSCGVPKTAQTPAPPAPLQTPAAGDDGKIEVVFLHINDVYEIGPLEGGKTGGMARVAAYYKQLKSKNPHTFFVHGGDFLSPSLMGTLKWNDERIRGRQMVEVMNASGVQLVTFGNHEFDVKEEELQARLNESAFYWLGTTVRRNAGGQLPPFFKMVNGEKKDCPDSFIWRVTDSDGTEARIGVFGLTLGSNPQDWVSYLPIFKTATEVANNLKDQTDVVIGLTHQERIDDLKLAGMLPYVPLIMGGHDHDHSIDTVGQTIIAKADANVKTVYVHRMLIDKTKKSATIRSELVPITDAMPSDPAVEALVNKWIAIQDENLRQVVDEPYEVVYNAKIPLDGLEKSVRNKQTNMGQLIASAMWKSSSRPIDAAFFNGGSIRIDDQLAGEILAIDIFRAMPFGGAVCEVEMKGGLLVKMLDSGLQNKGTGGYLQWANLSRNNTDTHWLLGGQTIDPAKIYRIATNDFLLTGKETRMDFFTPDHPDIKSVTRPKDNTELGSDIRKAVIDYMKKS